MDQPTPFKPTHRLRGRVASAPAGKPSSPPTERKLAYAAGAVAAVVFVMLVTYLPHMETQAFDQESGPWTRTASAYWGLATGTRADQPLPVHADEPMHWARMATMQREDTLRHGDPYTGTKSADTPLSLRGLVHEKGFYVAFAGFQEMSGVGWMDVIRLAPMLWAGITASLVIAALHPWRGAPLAAALVALVPTTPRFLGTGFFVPIGIGLAWIAASWLLMRHAAYDRRILPLLAAVGIWAFFVHLIAGFALLIFVLLAIPLLARRARRNVILIALVTVLPLLWLYEGFQPSVEDEFQRIGFLPTDFTAFDLLGIPFLILWIIGVTWVVNRPPKGSLRAPVWAATLASVTAFSFIVIDQTFDVNRYALYDRWHQPFALFATIPVAHGLVGVFDVSRDLLRRARNLALRLIEKRSEDPRAQRFHRYMLITWWIVPLVAFVVATSATAAVVTPSLNNHLDEPYYTIIDQDDWDAFNAARDLEAPYDTFLSHPWKAPIYTAMTGHRPHTWLQPGSPPTNGEDYEAYLRGKHDDTAWLVAHGITVVIDERAPNDEAYRAIAPNVWLLDEALAEQIEGIRNGTQAR